MNTRSRHHLTTALLVVLGTMAISCGSQTGKRQTGMNAFAATDSSHKIIAYYFHTTKRCASCYKIENYSKEAIQSNFADALNSGRLEWRMVNTDEPENKHFVEDYSLFTKSLILVEMKNGQQLRWKNCGKVWQLLNDKEKFEDYVRTEVSGFLNGA